MLLTTASCNAFDIESITFDYYAPGSLRIKYTGIRRAIIDEARDLLEDEWRSDAETLFNGRQISLSQYNSSLRRLNLVRSEYGLRGRWWERTWFQSHPYNKGGAPPTKQYVVGRTGDILDLGFAKINENFKFRFKEYNANITNEWKFKFSPQITGNTNDIISKVTCLFIFDYYIRNRRFFRFIIEAGYRKRLKKFIEFRIEIFNL